MLMNTAWQRSILNAAGQTPQEECTDQLGVASVIQDEIFWFEVPVNDSFGMQIGKRFHHACCVKSGRRIFKWTSEIQKKKAHETLVARIWFYLCFLPHIPLPQFDPRTKCPMAKRHRIGTCLGFSRAHEDQVKEFFRPEEGMVKSNLHAWGSAQPLLWTWPCPLTRHSLWSGGDES